jgi:hypothetical protein
LLQTDQPVIRAPEEQPDDEGNEDDDDDQSAATNRKFIHKIDKELSANRSGNARPSQTRYRPKTSRKK